MRLLWPIGYLALVVLTVTIIGASLRAAQLRDQYQQALAPNGQTGLYGKAFLETVTLASTTVRQRNSTCSRPSRRPRPK